METIRKEDLIIGETYKVVEGHYWMIGLIILPNNGDNNGITERGRATLIDEKNKFLKDTTWCYQGNNRTYKLSTPEEKHWLKECIKADKFISYEKAMKTFIPEYVECVSPEYWSKTIKQNNGNLIFKSDFKSTYEVQIIDILKKQPYVSFKPSTKEAYDAQFVVEETVEPLPQFKVIETIETITKVENNEGNQFFIGDVVTTDGSNITETIKSFEYHLNKTVLVAVFTNNSFININSIEHYIEPKVDFVLPKKWCIKSKNRIHDKILNSYARSIGATWWDDIRNFTSRLYMLVDNNQYFNSSDHKPTAYTEITFEQFEKHVLNKTVK